MGGIPTNWKGQVINPKKNDHNSIVHGLCAAGEAACSSVHGANRLGANSLLDIVIFGKACAENISSLSKPGDPIDSCDNEALQNDIDNYQERFHKKGDISSGELRYEMQKIMQKHGGVFRNNQLLEEGVQKLNSIYKDYENVLRDKYKEFNTEFIELVELENLLKIL